MLNHYRKTSSQYAAKLAMRNDYSAKSTLKEHRDSEQQISDAYILA